MDPSLQNWCALHLKLKSPYSPLHLTQRTMKFQFVGHHHTIVFCKSVCVIFLELLANFAKFLMLCQVDMYTVILKLAWIDIYLYLVIVKASAHYTIWWFVRLCISRAVVWADAAYYTERQKKHHFFRATPTKIHAIKINNICTQISFNTP